MLCTYEKDGDGFSIENGIFMSVRGRVVSRISSTKVTYIELHLDSRLECNPRADTNSSPNSQIRVHPGIHHPKVTTHFQNNKSSTSFGAVKRVIVIGKIS